MLFSYVLFMLSYFRSTRSRNGTFNKCILFVYSTIIRFQPAIELCGRIAFRNSYNFERTFRVKCKDHWNDEIYTFVWRYTFISHAHNCVVTTDFRMIGAFVVDETTSDDTIHGDTMSSFLMLLTDAAVLVVRAIPFPLWSSLCWSWSC